MGILPEEDWERVTVWFRCKVCSGYTYSIPALQAHFLTKHPSETFIVPRNIPPGAEKGKIFFSYIPSNGGRNKPSADELPSECPSGIQATSAPDNVSPQSPAPRSEVDECGYNIQVKNVAELLEQSSSEEEDNVQLNERDKLGESNDREVPVDSPPDSGMFEGGSEIHEGEGQPRQPDLAFTSGNSSNNINNNTSTMNLDVPDYSPSAISRGAATHKSQSQHEPKKGFSCTECHKSFKTQGILNFHVRKVHKKEATPVVPSTDTEKLVMKISRNSSTGSYSSISPKAEKDSAGSEAMLSKMARVTRGSSKRSTSSPQKPRRGRSSTVSSNLKEKDIAQMEIERVCSEAEAEAGSDWNPESNSGNRKRPKKLSSSESHSNSSSDEDTTPVKVGPRKSVRRKTRQQRKNASICDSSSDSFISPRRSKRLKGKEESSSSSEGELSDRSTTTPEKDDNDDAQGENKTDSSDSDSSDDLFVSVVVKKVKRRESASSQKTEEITIKTETSPSTRQQSAATCGVCKKEFAHSNALLRHMKEHGSTPVLVCGFCKKRFEEKDVRGFNAHIATHKG